MQNTTVEPQNTESMYIEYFTRVMVLHVFQQNNVKRSNTEELILRLTRIVSDKLAGEEFNITSKTLKNLNRTITKVLLKTFSSMEAALFYLTCEDPLMVECIISVIRKQAMVELNTAQRLFYNLGDILNKPLSCSFLNYGLCGLKDCAHLGAPRLRPRQ